MPENENNQPPEKKKKGFLWVIIIVLIIVLAAVIGGYALSYMPMPAWLSGFLPSHEVSAPAQVPVTEEPPVPTSTPPKTSVKPSLPPAPTPIPEESAEPTAAAKATEIPAPAVTPTPYIGADAAADAALKHSKASAKEADFTSVILAEQNGMMLYLVEFSAGDNLYEYQIDAMTARVESWRKSSSVAANAKDTVVTASADAKEVVSSPAPTAQAEPSPTVLIGEEEAKKLAMGHANIQESELVSIKCKVELEGLNLIYDVEMKTKLQEYDYEIDAFTGEIIGFDIEKR